MAISFKTVCTCTLVAALALLASCSSQKKVEKNTELADSYYDEYKYSEAIISYYNVLKHDPTNTNAKEKLCYILFNRGQYEQAIFALQEALESDPDNEELNIKFASCLLILNRWGEAKEQAKLNFEKFPKNPETAIFYADNARTPEEIEDTKKAIQDAITTNNESAAYRIALGLLELKSGNSAAAEKEYTQAEFLDRDSPAILSALGTYYWINEELEKAEQAFYKASTNAPHYSPRKLLSAQFKLRTGNVDEAISISKGIADQTPDHIPALQLLAEAFASKDELDSALTYADKVLKLNPYSIETNILKGRILHQQEKYPEAISAFEKLNEAYPTFPEAYTLIAQSYLVSGDESEAINILEKAKENNALSTFGLKLYADTKIKRKRYSQAKDALLELIEIEPNAPEIHFTLAQVQSALGETEEAIATYQSISDNFPNNPQSIYLAGLLQLQSGDLATAEKSFEESLKRNPEFPPAIEQLAQIDFSKQRYPQALARVDASLEAAPESAALHYLKGMILVRLNQDEMAQPSLAKAIELDPKNTQAYLGYATSLNRTGKLDQALASYKSILQIDPNHAEANYLLAGLYENRKEFDEAAKRYSKILETNPDNAVVHNNIAYLLSEYLGQKENALSHAKRARELQPENPLIADTLGWIAFQQKDYKWAYNLISEAYAKMPTSVEISYHLGLAAFRIGRQDEAKERLEFAQKTINDGEIKEIIAQTLDILNIDESKATEANIASLEQALSENANDPTLLYKLSRIYLNSDSLEKSKKLAEKIISLDDNNAEASFLLVDIYEKSASLDKAFERAKSNYTKFPDRLIAANQLGRLAFKKGDYPWALSLLSKAYQSESNLEDLAYYYAFASFAEGDMDNALKAAKKALSTTRDDLADQASRLERSLSLFASDTPNIDTASANLIESNNQIQSIPSILAYAKALELNGQNLEAVVSYQKVVSMLPNQTPALARMLRIKAREGMADEKLLVASNKVRRNNPDAYDLAVAVACLAYVNGNYDQATQLFETTTDFINPDAEALFFWGMAYSKNEQQGPAVKYLKQAIQKGLQDPYLSQANAIISQGS